ncbi:MAG: alpha-amylase/4-alpha-glucanotransferase domain-containing protein [Pirellulales bacterium]
MSQSIRLIFVLHDHQPVGNFDHVFEQAYQDAYLPFLDVFERYEHLKIGLHTSGPLLEWLDAHHGDYLDRVARLTEAGRIEIIGGAFYEPILSMIPSRDRIAQIQTSFTWLERRLGARVRGVWIPERVWEQSMTRDLVAAGAQYTMLDDFHFKNAGLAEDQLHGYYLTEDEGQLLAVFPDSEPLRYMIPFRPPEETIAYLRQLAERHPGAIVMFGDDGEKFGAWPGTKHSVYEEGWLVRLFDLLAENRGWIDVVTPSEAIDAAAPVGKVYLPEGSYREMTEWALPTEQLGEYVEARRDLEGDPRWPRIARFVRGGFWRNFRVKYPEADEMYTRMMMVSKKLQAALDDEVCGPLVDAARAALHRGQCNCAYWHGAFGGVYLPHLRNAIYHQLIEADNLLDKALKRPETWVDLTADDYNIDGRQEVQLAGDKLLALFAPARGGLLYELEVRPIAHNLLATMARRPEAYHRKVQAGNDGRNDVAGVSDQVIFKQADLEKHLQYDKLPRKSLIDHFYDTDVSLEAVVRGEAAERGDFPWRSYEAKLRRNPRRMQAQLIGQGLVGERPLRITKSITLEAGRSTLEIHYLLEGLPQDQPLLFAVEFNFAGMPAGADDRYFYGDQRQRFGQLGTRLDLHDAAELGLVDEWLGLDVNLSFSRASSIWTFPIECVSQSEGGFELVHQSVAVLPHWHVVGDADGRWSVAMNLAIDTQQAEVRQQQQQRALAMAT